METPLCKLAQKYGTDKCPQIKHNYTPHYYKLLKNKRNKIKKVLEIGIGYYEDMERTEVHLSEYTGALYHKGASLKMWRDFFPNAKIYGADIELKTMFKDKRIKTFLCDETKEKDIKKLIIQTGSDIDLFIDDGSHARNHQVFLARNALPLLKKDVIYVIEDVTYPNYVIKRLRNYDCLNIFTSSKWRDDGLLLVSNKV